MKFTKVIKPRFEKFKAEASSLNGYFQDWIEYEHWDLTRCKFNYATYKKIEDGWFGIFTEHNGSIMLNEGDVKWIKKNNKLIYVNKDYEE